MTEEGCWVKKKNNVTRLGFPGRCLDDCERVVIQKKKIGTIAFLGSNLIASYFQRRLHDPYGFSALEINN